ncbi:retrotransposon protein, putative, ty1-copia subclass [Tanacetum coccineum]
MAIQGGRIQKANKKSLNAKGKEHPYRDDTCHHCKEVGHYKRKCTAYLAELIKKKKQVGTASSSDIFQLTPPYTPQHNRVFERRNRTLLDIVRLMMSLTTMSLSFWNYALETATRILNMVPTKKVDKTSYELWYGKIPNLSYLKVWGCEALVKRDTPDKLQQRSFLEKNLISQEVSGRAVELEEIQDEDTSPSENTSEITIEVEGFKPPQEDVIPVCRSVRTHQAPERLCLNVEVEEHSLGDLNEPTNYKATLLDLESDKWLDAMNAEMQSMKDNQVWCLVDLHPNCFVDPNHPRKVCMLQRSIYGPKRASRSWNKIFDKEIKRFKMDNSKRGNISMQERVDLNKTQDASTLGEVKRMQNIPYASAVGSIMYAVRCTRLDVAFTQNITRCFQHNPRKPQWTAVKTILKYLRNTKDMFLVYGRNPKTELRVDCYCNARFETDRDEIKSQTGYAFILNERRSRLENLQVKYYCNVRYRS